jgi:hypothetical protein
MRHHTYYQASGVFIIDLNHMGNSNVWAFEHVCCYAGKGPTSATGYNNPEMEHIQCGGPLPCGFYDVKAPVDNPKTTGPFSLALSAWRPLYGRDGFFIHGDNAHINKTASDGCIVMPLAFRSTVWESGIHVLAVLRG